MDAQRIPAQFHAGLITVQTRTPDGEPLVFDVDSGGTMILFRRTVARLGLAAREEEAEWGGKVSVVDLTFDAGTRVPPPTMSFMVQDELSWMQGDGMLGQQWHADRVWTYDYRLGRLWVGDAVGQGPRRLGHSICLGLPPLTEAGRRPHAFATVEACIAGRVLVFLFDTGARVALTSAASARMEGGGPTLRATCFVGESLLREWQTRHPDWLCVQAGDAIRGGSLIRVPLVEMAGHQVGPVWFTGRPDANFEAWTFLDRPVCGALGGELLRQFTSVIADYRNGWLSLVR